MLMPLLKTLLPPSSKELLTDDDWEHASAFWVEQGNDQRATFCRCVPIVNGHHQGMLIPRDAPLDIVLGREDYPHAPPIVYGQSQFVSIGLRFRFYQVNDTPPLTQAELADATVPLIYGNLLKVYLTHIQQSPESLIPFGEFPLPHFTAFCLAHGAAELNDLLCRSLLRQGEAQGLIEYTEVLNWRIRRKGAELAAAKTSQ